GGPPERLEVGRGVPQLGAQGALLWEVLAAGSGGGLPGTRPPHRAAPGEQRLQSREKSHVLDPTGECLSPHADGVTGGHIGHRFSPAGRSCRLPTSAPLCSGPWSLAAPPPTRTTAPTSSVVSAAGPTCSPRRRSSASTPRSPGTASSPPRTARGSGSSPSPASRPSSPGTRAPRRPPTTR